VLATDVRVPIAEIAHSITIGCNRNIKQFRTEGRPKRFGMSFIFNPSKKPSERVKKGGIGQ